MISRYWTRLANWLFPQPSAQQIERDQLEAAERHHVEHLAAAEHHFALSNMYAAHAQRIRNKQQGKSHHDILPFARSAIL